MSFFKKLIDDSEQEFQRLQENPDRWEEEYEDVSGEFLPPEVGYMISEFQAGRFDYEKFLQLSTEKRQQFLEYISEHFPIQMNIQEKTA